VPHDVERTHQYAKALIIIGAEKVEIGARRAAADAEAQAAAGQCLDRLHAMGELDRMAQGDLQHGGAELDPLGRGGQRPEGDERVQGGLPPAQGVGHPNPRKPALFDPARVIDDTGERAIARLGAGRIKVTTLNLMTTYRIGGSATRAPPLINRKSSDNNAIDPPASPIAEWLRPRRLETESCRR
jgi:hypothetical protein